MTGSGAAPEQGLRPVWRIPAGDVPGGRLVLELVRGRVELGQARGADIRVRAALAPGHRARFWSRGAGGLRQRSEPDALTITARRGRIRLDLPADPAVQLAVEVRVGRGEITSWGAGGELALTCPDGSVTCRELTARVLRVRSERVNVHFAAEPELVEIDADEVTVALPGGPYEVAAPDGAEVTVVQLQGSARRVNVRALRARVLSAQTPLRLTSDPQESG